jgi:hypothetical protein
MLWLLMKHSPVGSKNAGSAGPNYSNSRRSGLVWIGGQMASASTEGGPEVSKSWISEFVMVVGCGRENGIRTKTADASDVALGRGDGNKKGLKSIARRWAKLWTIAWSSGGSPWWYRAINAIVNCSPHTRMPKKNAPCECSRVLRKGLVATTLAEFAWNRVMMEKGLVYHRGRADLSY